MPPVSASRAAAQAAHSCMPLGENLKARPEGLNKNAE